TTPRFLQPGSLAGRRQSAAGGMGPVFARRRFLPPDCLRIPVATRWPRKFSGHSRIFLYRPGASKHLSSGRRLSDHAARSFRRSRPERRSRSDVRHARDVQGIGGMSSVALPRPAERVAILSLVLVFLCGVVLGALVMGYGEHTGLIHSHKHAISSRGFAISSEEMRKQLDLNNQQA